MFLPFGSSSSGNFTSNIYMGLVREDIKESFKVKLIFLLADYVYNEGMCRFPAIVMHPDV